MLWALYFVQGLPFGFQATALPVLLREGGASLTVIGLAGLVALPWILKPLWAPWVDRSATRKSWVIPMQALLAVAMGLAAWVGDTQVLPLLACVALMNLFAATLDIAVDGLAVDMLAKRDLGMGNAAQVVGYKFGMLTGGGLLLWASARIGHAAAVSAIAGVVIAILAVTLVFHEPPRPAERIAQAKPTYGTVARTLGRTLLRREMRWLVVAIATYKLGETVSDTMFKPWLSDVGFDRAQIGVWVGTWGMGLSLCGSLAGGWLASRWRIENALTLFAVLRIFPLAAQWWLTTQGEPPPDVIIAVTCAEHFFGGGLTTAMFALMMSRVDRAIGATHFTALAALEVAGKAVPGLASGALADTIGFPSTFAVAVLLSIAFLFVLPKVRLPPTETGD